MRALHRWTIAAGLAALAGAGAAFVRHGGPGAAEGEAAADGTETGAADADAASPDAREALDAARARLRARAEELHREIDGQERPAP